jgi:murein L,D-transpeptidase YafK
VGIVRRFWQSNGGSRRWVALSWALALSATASGLPGSVSAGRPQADSWILVDARAQTLSVFRGDELIERFDNIAIGRGGLSSNRTRGDGTTPSGTFHIDRIRRSSRFVLFFGIDFPRPEQARRALDRGRVDDHDYRRIVAAFERNESPPQDTPLGGQLGIHGLGTAAQAVHDAFNWTQGCVALTNVQIKRLSKWVYLGMRVEIR